MTSAIQMLQVLIVWIAMVLFSCAALAEQRRATEQPPFDLANMTDSKIKGEVRRRVKSICDYYIANEHSSILSNLCTEEIVEKVYLAHLSARDGAREMIKKSNENMYEVGVFESREAEKKWESFCRFSDISKDDCNASFANLISVIREGWRQHANYYINKNFQIDAEVELRRRAAQVPPPPPPPRPDPAPQQQQQQQSPNINTGAGNGAPTRPHAAQPQVDNSACVTCMTQRNQSCDMTLQSCEMGCTTTNFLPSEVESLKACRLRCASHTSSCKSGARSDCAGICR